LPLLLITSCVFRNKEIPADEYEEDSLATPVNLKINDTIQRTLHSVKRGGFDRDYFIIRHENTGEMEIEVESDIDVSMMLATPESDAIWTPDGLLNYIATNEPPPPYTDPPFKFFSGDIEAGLAYYLFVEPYKGEAGKYKLTVTFSKFQYAPSTFADSVYWSTNQWSYPSSIRRYKTDGHFLQIYKDSDYTNKVVFSDGSISSVQMRYKTEVLPSLNMFQTVTVFYYWDRYRQEGVLEHIEMNGNYFIIGETLVTQDKLNLRDSSDLDGNILQILPINTEVTILEENKIETIDEITSAWVRIEVVETGLIGWCFGGYLGFRI
jgi:hypothetical protein